MSEALERLVEARGKVRTERAYNGESSHSNVAVYMLAYRAAEAYISELEKRLEVIEHAHDWTRYKEQVTYSPRDYRHCDCGQVQIWGFGNWRDLFKLKEEQ